MPVAEVTIVADYRIDELIEITLTSSQKRLSDFSINKSAITKLKIVSDGQAMDNADFIVLRDEFPKLKELDLSGISNTAIPANAFANNKTIKTISLPAGLTGIGVNAFVNTALEGVINIPINVNGAANVDDGRFGNSQGITGFVADPNSSAITTVDGVVFNKLMTELHYYPCGKTDIGYTIPEGVTTIRNGAFDFNHNLKNLTIASTTNSIHTAGGLNYYAVCSISEIENIYVDVNNTLWGSINGIVYEKATNKVVWSPRGKTEIRIAAPITEIAGGNSQNSIFGGNASFSKGGTSYSNNYAFVVSLVDLPATVNRIHNGAFVATANLATFICRATVVPVNYGLSFNSVGSNFGYATKVYVPASALNDYKESTWVNDKKGPDPDKPETEITFKGFTATNILPFYNVAITSGVASSPLASDIAAQNQKVTITAAPAPEGKKFEKWTTESGITLEDETAVTTTFTMPASDVAISATYKSDPTTSIGATQASLSLYPNPATDYIQLSGAENTSYAIYSIVGKLLTQGITQGEAIPVSGLAPGVYLFKAGDKTLQFVKK
jgi:hypothetical protein